MKLVSWLLLTSFALCGTVQADAAFDLDRFSHIPVLEDGRVIPLDSFARQKLTAFSGKSSYDRQPAIQWLADLLFKPESAGAEKVFLVDNPEVMEALGIEAESRDRYAFMDLAPAIPKLYQLYGQAIQIDEEERSQVENQIIQLAYNLDLYQRLSKTLDFALPHETFTISHPDNAGLVEQAKPGPYSFGELWLQADKLRTALQDSHVPEDELTPAQRELIRLSNRMNQWSQGKQNSPLALLPFKGHTSSWVSPWSVIAHSAEQPELRTAIAQLCSIGRAYREGSQVELDMAVAQYLQGMHKEPDADTVKDLKREVRFNRLKLFRKTETLYGLAFLLALFSLIRTGPLLYRIATVLVLAGLIPHSLGILARMHIMDRPPVTNLYSTFLFVAWVGVILCLILERIQKNRLGLLTASASGLMLMLTAARFSSEGDNMGVMVAVLDSNFWLATHVITITMGYAGCFVAGVIGHIYLVKALFKPDDDPSLVETYDAMYGTLAFGLIFSFLGTMLGGVWADQSWGRFWGWDPKENGALIIVLWSAILFHAKLGRLIGPRGFAAGSIIGIVFVLMAWIGVNLLGVGLHSYGFTSSLAIGLFIATSVEITFIIGAALLGRTLRAK